MGGHGRAVLSVLKAMTRIKYRLLMVNEVAIVPKADIIDTAQFSANCQKAISVEVSMQ
jgi:hypothetical protein